MAHTATRPAPAPSRVPSNDYRELKRRVQDAGLLEAQSAYYIFKSIVALATVGLVVWIAAVSTSTIVLLGNAALLGFASTQIALLGHDVGHRQGYRGKRLNLFGRYLWGSLLLGISHSWWNDKHNQHHATPNHVDKDPDIQFPMIAFAESQISSRRRIFLPIIKFQAFIFAFLFPLQALNMRLTSASYLLSGKARKPWLQAAGMAAHLGLYVLLLSLLPSWQMALAFFVVHQGTFGLYNSSVFASNHKGMPTIDENGRMDFFREQVITSRNVTIPTSLPRSITTIDPMS
jgi:fatty acid desaturase